MSSRLLRGCLAAVLLAHGALASAAETGLRYISTAGDYIGGGIQQTLKAPAANIGVDGSNAQVVRASVSDANNWWSLEFAAPSGAALALGSYADASRYPFQSPLRPGLSMSGNGRGCNELRGWFRVLELERDAAGTLKRLAVDFVQNCEVNGPPLYGVLRYRSNLPLTVPSLAAVAGPDVAVVSGEAVRLDGGQSFTRRKGATLTRRWTQLDGPAVVLDSDSAASPGFTAPAVPLEGATLRFGLEVSDGSGSTASDEVLVVVNSAQAPRTEVNFHGDAGDYITLGGSYRYRPADAQLRFERNFANGVSVSVYGGDWWNLDFAAPSGQKFKVGAYKGAARFPFQDTTQPGLSLYGAGRGCNTLTGKFNVRQAKFNKDGTPAVFEADFTQHCEGSRPAAYGQVLLNAVPVAQQAAQIAQARARLQANGATGLR